MAGDSAGDVASYRRYLALPAYRRGVEVDPVVYEFVA